MYKFVIWVLVGTMELVEVLVGLIFAFFSVAGLYCRWSVIRAPEVSDMMESTMSTV